jgi:trehalose 6-phosphate synthase/phosphatase
MKPVSLTRLTDRGPGGNGANGTSRLIVLSNREPYEHGWRKGQVICRPTDGGLSTALDPIMRRFGGVWVAWGSGEADREATGPADVLEVPPDAPAYQLRRVWLSPEEVKGGYLGYANEVLWPLCHITLDRVAYRRAFWEPYVSLNRRFADAALEELQRRPGSVWVHDFHLALVPRLIKDASPQTRVFVFWHVPWPGPDVFRVLPERLEILRGLLAADSIVFQTPSYGEAFADCARRFLHASVDVDDRAVRLAATRTTVTARAISVDFHHLSARAKTPPVERAMALARRRLMGHPLQSEAMGTRPGLRLGLGVDRLDYTKGLLKRLWGLDAFFTKYPEYCGAFTFVQVAVPTRGELEAYRRYRKLIWQTVFELNDKHGYPEGQDGVNAMAAWRPVEFLEGKIDSDTLLAYYRLADIALVSSVYDGMNLVAKEYVACQVDEAGVLLVSQMAGCSEELTEALIINPYDPESLADAIRAGLEMPIVERQRRMRAMRDYLASHDLYAWAESCLRDAGVSSPRRSGEDADPVLAPRASAPS